MSEIRHYIPAEHQKPGRIDILWEGLTMSDIEAYYDSRAGTDRYDLLICHMCDEPLCRHAYCINPACAEFKCERCEAV